MTIGALVAFNMLAGRVSGPLVQIVTMVHEYQEVALSVRMLGEIMNQRPEQCRPRAWHRARADRRDRVRKRLVPLHRRARRRSTMYPSRAGRLGVRHRRQERLRQDDDHPADPGAVSDAAGAGALRRLRRPGNRPGPSAQEHRRRACRTASCSAARCATTSPPQSPTRARGGRAAARIAGAEEFIERLPRGFDTMLEENGSNLSGGQKQRLAIARALVPIPRLSSSMRRRARSIPTARRSSAQNLRGSPRGGR